MSGRHHGRCFLALWFLAMVLVAPGCPGSGDDLPREAVPTEWLNSPEVWAALVPHMPMEAMVRNLAKMTVVGLVAPAAVAAGRDFLSAERRAIG